MFLPRGAFRESHLEFDISTRNGRPTDDSQDQHPQAHIRNQQLQPTIHTANTTPSNPLKPPKCSSKKTPPPYAASPPQPTPPSPTNLLPPQLIRHTITNFNIAPDKLCVARVSESLTALQQARDLRLGDAEDSLKRLARTLNSLSSQHQDLTASHSSAAHASEIARLDTQKFRVAKGVSDLEMETERLQAQAADLSARLQELELQGVDGGDFGTGTTGSSGGVEDEVLLRLKVYRSLGIDIERDEKEGEFSRAVVRNDRKGDVHVINIDRKFSRYFYANYFWQTL